MVRISFDRIRDEGCYPDSTTSRMLTTGLQKNRSYQAKFHENDISTQQYKKEEDSRVPGTDVHQIGKGCPQEAA